ncbi:CopD family protein [Streptomyces sp. E11-3]|uniref:CopD family protein n=1 Tax=Streptomyces sp. E11-3 TaxID=3110112 RepID=UPI003980E9F2
MSMSRPPVTASPSQPQHRDGSPSTGPAVSRRAAYGRAAAVLVLLLAAVLVPLLGPSVALDGTGEREAPGTGVITLLRTVLYAALCVQVGEVATARLARRVPDAPSLVPRSWAAAAATVGAIAALGLAVIVANGNLLPQSLADVSLDRLYQSRDGVLALIEVNGFVAAAFCAQSRRPTTAVLPLGALIVAEALRAHPWPESTPMVGSALTLVHLTSAAVWAGGLLQVLRTMRLWHGSRPEAAVALLGRYARVAAVLFAAITVTGICSTLRRLPLDSVFDTAYGRTMVAKLLLVAVIAVLALLARRRLRHASDPCSAAVPAQAEVVVLGLAVVVSALLTAVPTPIWW